MPLRRFLRRIRTRPLSDTTIRRHLSRYEVLAETPRASEGDLLSRLESSRDFDFVNYSVDPDAFARYCKNEAYEERFPKYFEEFGAPDVWPRKLLEHFLSFDIIKPHPGGTYIDVAASNSPVVDILRTRYRVAKAYKQDLRYPAGVHGGIIGSNANAIPLPDASVDGILSHNSWEHFEGRADRGFLQESARLLRRGGTLCIVPLNIAAIGYQATSPAYWAAKALDGRLPEFDPRLPVVVRDDLKQRLVKVHSPDTLAEDVRLAAGIRFTVYRIENAARFGFQSLFLVGQRG